MTISTLQAQSNSSLPIMSNSSSVIDQQPRDVLSSNLTEDEDFNHHQPVNGPSQVTIRSLVSTKEAGIIIGKEGRTVAQMRESTRVMARVSRAILGVNDRILTIFGPLDDVAKAFCFIAHCFADNMLQSNSPSSMTPISDTKSSEYAEPQFDRKVVQRIRLLVPHLLMGAIIGKQGSKIREIQDHANVKLIAPKELLPQSTERLIEVYGSPESIELAIRDIGQCLANDWERAVGAIFYQPIVRLSPKHIQESQMGVLFGRSSTNVAADISGRRKLDTNKSPGQRPYFNSTNGTSSFTSQQNPKDIRQLIPIPADMVGCIIGRGGTKINEVRQISGCQITIDKEANEAGERMFTIVGSKENTEKAIGLLYQRLEEQREQIY